MPWASNTDVVLQDRLESSFHIPSCMVLEGCITVFFNSFLCHMPCIHIPTWRAEDAHPSLLLGMIAIGLVYRSRRELANIIYRAARLSIIRHVIMPQNSRHLLHTEAHILADGVIHKHIEGSAGLDNADIILDNGLRNLER